MRAISQATAAADQIIRCKAQSLLPSGSRKYARYNLPAEPSRTPGGSSQEVAPVAIPVECHASTCSRELQVKPIVPPLAGVAGWPLIGFDTEKTPVLVK